jgi:hypothetical protein
LNLSSDFLVSEFAFQCNLCRYSEVARDQVGVMKAERTAATWDDATALVESMTLQSTEEGALAEKEDINVNSDDEFGPESGLGSGSGSKPEAIALPPLHAALERSESLDVIAPLLAANPVAAMERDGNGNLPLHVALETEPPAAVVGLYKLNAVAP